MGSDDNRGQRVERVMTWAEASKSPDDIIGEIAAAIQLMNDQRLPLQVPLYSREAGRMVFKASMEAAYPWWRGEMLDRLPMISRWLYADICHQAMFV